jgi:hypothetical protein
LIAAALPDCCSQAKLVSNKTLVPFIEGRNPRRMNPTSRAL